MRRSLGPKAAPFRLNPTPFGGLTFTGETEVQCGLTVFEVGDAEYVILGLGLGFRVRV